MSILITPPSEYPVTIREVMDHLNNTNDDDTPKIARAIRTATQTIEIFTGRRLITQTREHYFDRFCDIMELPDPPLQSVESIKYIDHGGVLQTLPETVYTVDTKSTIGRVLRAYDQSWPSTRNIPQAITIRYVAGYGSAEHVPDRFKDAILLDAQISADWGDSGAFLEQYLNALRERRDALVYNDRISSL